MKFPVISDIASRSVISVDISSSISDALDTMLEHNHRNLIVNDGESFRVLTVVNILEIQLNNVDLDIELSSLNLSKIPTINKNKNILDTLEFLNDNLEYIGVLNDDNSLYGLVTHTDITSNIDPDTLMDNYRLADFLRSGRRVKWVSPEVKTSALLDEMLKGLLDNVIAVEDMKPIGK